MPRPLTSIRKTNSSSSPLSTKKRVAIQSPTVSPQKDTTTEDVTMQDTELEESQLTPTNLVQRFNTQTTYKPMTPAEARAKVATDKWKTEWDHPQILNELLSDTPPPNSIDILPYEFDTEDPTTQTLLLILNGPQICNDMKRHVLKVKKQEFSRMHPKFGPFKLQCLDKPQDKYTVLNRKEDRAYTFKGKDYQLDLNNTDFDVQDTSTYSLVCLLGAQTLWEEILQARTDTNASASEDKGPFQVMLSQDEGKITFKNKDGDTWQSAFSPGPQPEAPWTTVHTHQALPAATHPKITADMPIVTNSNRYSILQHNDKDHNTTQMDVDLPPRSTLWQEESDEEAAQSGDERTPPSLNLKDVCVLDTDTADSTLTSPSSVTHTSDPFKILDGTDGQHLLNIEIQLQPGAEHLQVLFTETKNLLSYIQQVDKNAQFMSKALQSDGSPYPPLKSPTDKHWPSSFLAAQNWYQSSMGYLFSQDPVSEKQLLARLDTKKGRLKREATQLSKQSALEEKGPTAMYATMNLYTTYPDIQRLLDSVNVDLRKNKVKVSLKELQCWESSPKKILCGVNSNLCVDGIKQLLLHKLKELEKRMCRHGRLNAIDWYDAPLPELIVSLRGIRPLKLPKDEEEKSRLTFDTFPWESKMAFYLEASDSAWYRLAPLMDLLVETNTLSNTFGPSAYIMEVPAQNQKISIEKVRSHHRIGRISMGYNIATTILECNEVQLFDYDVKVAMEPIQTTAADGSTTLTTPKPPYAKTNLRKELQRIRFNGELLFHTAVITCKGPDSGLSRIVIPYKPSDPLRAEKYNFAKRTVSNLACFMFHWWQECGYNESTRKRLMRSFYIEKSQLAEHSSWDSETKTASSHFATKSSTYLEDNSEYDPQTSNVKCGRIKQPSIVDMSDQLRSTLLKQLGQDKDHSPNDYNSHISNVSPHTGDGDESCASTINSSNTANKILKTKDFALQLAESRAKQADQVALIAQLQQQMENLKRLQNIAEPSSQQGAPHLSGSGASPPSDPGGGEALQGP
jgi:hypothetical protein